MPKKILIVSAGFFPQNSPRSFRTTELVKEFARQGHDVTLYTVRDDQLHPEFENKYHIKIKNIGKLKHTAREKEPFVTRIISRGLLYLFDFPEIQYMAMVKKALSNESGFDLLISIAAPHSIHWGVASAINTKKDLLARKWIADCGDPYMGCKTDNYKKVFYFKYLEKFFCKKADFITVPTEDSIAGYYKEFHHKVRVIPQGFDLGNFILPQNFKKNPVTTFIYAGSIIPGIRDPINFLKYLCGKKEPFKFIIFTQVKWHEMLNQYKEVLEDRLVLNGFIERENLLEVLSEADFLVNIENNTAIQTPSKLIDYAISGRPILSIRNSLDTELIDNFLKGNYEGQVKIDLQKYDIRNITKAFLEIV